ncbi:MAG: glutathione S-transferase family protein [Pseudomonadota bacterium]|nr:glutathione S-transferase family protein [Pseudomonadota bacterium]
MKLHADPITINCRKVLAGLDLIGAEFELAHVDYFKGEHRGDDYRKINPNASVPTLIDGDFVLWESNAILAYVADKVGNDAAYPTDPRRRADINRWLFWEGAHWFPSCYVYLVEHCVKPLLQAAPDMAIIASQDDNFHKLAGILDARLAQSKWIAGDQPSIADIALAAPAHLHPFQRLPLDRHVHLRRWLVEGVEQLPCWDRTFVGEGFTTQRNKAA